MASLAGLAKKIKDSLDAGKSGSMANKFWSGNAGNNLVTLQKNIQNKKVFSNAKFNNPNTIPQALNNASLGYSDTFVGAPLRIGETTGGFYRDAIQGNPITNRKIKIKNLAKDILQVTSGVAGASQPLQTALYAGLSGGITGASKKLAGASTKDAVKSGIIGAIESAPRAQSMAGISKYTNPLIDKAAGIGTSFAARNAIKSPLNVGEGLLMDTATDSKTTKESVLIDALFPVVGDALSVAAKALKGKISSAIKAGDESGFDNAVREARNKGIKVNKNALNKAKTQLFRDAKGKFTTEAARVTEKDIPFSYMGVDQPPIKMREVIPNQAAFGALGGVETYQDENGNWKVRFNPSKGVLGVAAVTGAQKLKDTGALDQIIEGGRKQIGTVPEVDRKPLSKKLDDFYTQWVDRYHPIIKTAETVRKDLKKSGSELLPQADPTFLVRRLTGAGGIADSRYQRELKPVIGEIEAAGIPKADIDVYLANRRIAGFGKAGRDVYGADPKKASQIIAALEEKYGQPLKDAAGKLYEYQNKGFQEMIDAGFISPEVAATIKSQNPDYSPLYRVMDEMDDYLGLPTRKTMQGSQPIKKLKGSDRQIVSPLESIIGNTYTQRAAIEKNRVAKSIINLQKVAPDLGFTQVKEAGSDTITVWNNGQKEYWQVGKDIADTAKGVDEESMNTVLKIFQAPAALLRQGATGRNPEFMIPNIIRDQLDAGISSKYGYIPFVDFLSGLKSIVTDDEMFKKWEQSGAKIDLGELSGRKSIADSFKEKTTKKKLFGWIGDILDTMGMYSEQPTRVGLFKRAYKKTGSTSLAAMESRDATVDFARMGSKMRVANSIVPFLNVGVQGFDKLIRAVKDNPAKVAFYGTLYGVVPALTTTLYNLSNYPQEYAEIPQYVKDSNYVIVKGRNGDGTVDYITIAKGNIAPLMANPVENMLSYAHGQNQQTFGEFATSFLSSALPVVGDGSSLKEVGIKTIGSNLPQLIKPATESLLNKSFYKYDPKNAQSKEIVPYYMQDKPAAEQAYTFTPQLYKSIGGLINVSPLHVKNLMEGYLAGYIKIPVNIMESINSVKRGEEVNPNNITIMRRFFGRTYESGNSNKGSGMGPKRTKEGGVKVSIATPKARTAKVRTSAYKPVRMSSAKFVAKAAPIKAAKFKLTKPKKLKLAKLRNRGNKKTTVKFKNTLDNGLTKLA